MHPGAGKACPSPFASNRQWPFLLACWAILVGADGKTFAALSTIAKPKVAAALRTLRPAASTFPPAAKRLQPAGEPAILGVRRSGEFCVEQGGGCQPLTGPEGVGQVRVASIVTAMAGFTAFFGPAAEGAASV